MRTLIYVSRIINQLQLYRVVDYMRVVVIDHETDALVVVVLLLPMQPSRSNLEDMHCSRLDSNTVYRERGRSVGSGGPMRSRPVEKRVDTSPYSCGPYLSPPSADLSWRRTNSDSALHQSVQNPNNTLHSPGSQRRGKCSVCMRFFFFFSFFLTMSRRVQGLFHRSIHKCWRGLFSRDHNITLSRHSRMNIDSRIIRKLGEFERRV